MLKYFPSGDSAIIVKASDQISVEINNTIRRLLTRVEMESIPGITDFIPSYNELMICFNPSLSGFHKLVDTIRSLEPSIADIHLPPSTLKEVPVLYKGDTLEEIGPDLEDVARFNKLSVDEVIQIHSSATYLVYMLGFTPGFCYLGGMDSRIAMPRKESPRLKIPEGSVGPLKAREVGNLLAKPPSNSLIQTANRNFFFRLATRSGLNQSPKTSF